MAAQFYKFTKIHWIVHLKMNEIVIWKSNLNKTFLKSISLSDIKLHFCGVTGNLLALINWLIIIINQLMLYLILPNQQNPLWFPPKSALLPIITFPGKRKNPPTCPGQNSSHPRLLIRVMKFLILESGPFSPFYHCLHSSRCSSFSTNPSCSRLLCLSSENLWSQKTCSIMQTASCYLN